MLREREFKDDIMVFCLSNCKDRVVINWDGIGYEWGRFGGEIRRLVWDILIWDMFLILSI